MVGVWVLVAVVLFALLSHKLWSVREHKRHQEDHAVAADVSALGSDLVPVSIHPAIDPARCIGSGACIAACPEEKVLGMVNGQASLINPLACIGHGACLAACPVQAIELVFGTAHRGVELPQVGPDFQTNQPGVYVVGELGGMGLIRNAVEQGRQASRAIVASGRRGGGETLDALVVGAGPAGISATLSLVDAGLTVELLEQGEYGGTIRHYPRAKVVMTGVIELARYGKVSAKTMTKEDLLALWDEIREGVGLKVATGERVEAITRAGDAWVVRSTGGERRAATVVLALGRRGAPRRLDVPGEELPKVSYRVLEPTEFKGKHALVVGGGNAAADAVVALVEEGGCASVSLSYRRAALARMRPSVREKLEGMLAAGRVRPLLSTEVVEIQPRQVLLKHLDGHVFTVANDAVVVQVGGTSPSELLASFGIKTVEKRGEA